MKILVTGAAGFIGFHLSLKLLDQGNEIVGLDNLNDYYDVSLKKARLEQLTTKKAFTFYKTDLVDRESLKTLFEKEQITHVVNLAAQVGVRYSLTNPHAYIDANLVGFCNILENCRHQGIKHLLFASSSSVYGANGKQPFSEHDSVDHPISLYAATKKSNELMAHSYSHLYQLPTTGLRFFTVYGPWGRPDMALFKFTKNILENKPIDIYNNGDMARDFTYVDDIVEGISRMIDAPPTGDSHWDPDKADASTSYAPYRIYNIGNNSPVKLMTFVEALEESIGKSAIKNLMPMQPGDVPSTFADTSDLMNDFGFKPKTTIPVGIKRFVDWYREFYQV